jgi:arginine utilization protein RocB
LDISALCREFALALTGQPSVTGSEDEVAFGPWLTDYLANHPALHRCNRSWCVPVSGSDQRQVVFLLAKGSVDGPTVVLTGHYDTVTTRDYGDLEHLALKPDRLKDALLEKLAAEAGAPERLAFEDLKSGNFLPGRGLLDMKGGLAAGLAAMAAISAEPFSGNLLFIAVPDEENASAGARAAVEFLPSVASRENLDIKLVINLDAIADVGDGFEGQVLATGTVGKLLPTALVIGRPVHSGYATRGLNAAVLASAIAAKLEWAPELVEDCSTVPTLLSLKDSKTHYDVTTPATAFLFWNLLFKSRNPIELIALLEDLIAEAVADCIQELAERSRRIGADDASHLIAKVPVIRFDQLLDAVEIHHPLIHGVLAALSFDLRHLDAPERSRRLTLALWEKSGLTGPAVICGLGAEPYLSTSIRSLEVMDLLREFVSQAAARYRCSLRLVDHFAGISDMSFFGESSDLYLRTLSPLCSTIIQSNAISHAAKTYPTINLGPWGRDYHTPLERIQIPYSIELLPRLIVDLVRQIGGPAMDHAVRSH